MGLLLPVAMKASGIRQAQLKTVGLGLSHPSAYQVGRFGQTGCSILITITSLVYLVGGLSASLLQT